MDLAALDPATIPSDVVEVDFVSRHGILPLRKGDGGFSVAVAGPTGFGALDECRRRTGIEPLPVVVDDGQLQDAIARYREGLRGVGDELDAGEVDPGRGSAADEFSQAVDEAPVVKYVHQILADAIEAGASDIHFEPYEHAYRIRSRIDGMLREVRRPPVAMAGRLAARLKVMAEMDITERRVPQDGRIKLDPGHRAVAGDQAESVNIRVSTLPTLYGEKIVLRVMDPATVRLGIDELGFDADARQRFVDALDQPQGMILVTGPTGSGKTVTLYAGINRLNSEERNIATAEEPVEINLEGVNQVQVNTRIGLDFATALRAFLRQDPDVLMVGEIRDLETAQTAIKAAQTGHLVLSTLHTNSAAETLTRLRTMGIAPFNIATSVTLIVAQRLARLLCRHCRVRLDLPDKVLLDEGFTEKDLATGFDVFDTSTIGCGHCDRGYFGRTGIYEVVAMPAQMQQLVLRDPNSVNLADRARTLGFESLRRDGLKKVMRGLTSLREVNRVTARA